MKDLIRKILKEEIGGYRIVDGTEEHFKGIKKITNQHRKELGFVMQPALREAIKRGELKVALNSEGEVIGFVHWRKRRDGFHKIYEIAVERGWIGSGLGKELFNTVPKPRTLKTTIDNERGNEFYRRQGMEHKGVEQGRKRKLNIYQDPNTDGDD
ncbi:MAG: GNAT family N-acetyltransferase [Candidatus Dadabacteria bacterium]|nr:GNAT family N-acetyltransferase [Candidatus Dadabacteria bacterium]NIQ15755.1 GNAT family N-acetyltransferase [Candidatus Dadabacteria bacterium]